MSSSFVTFATSAATASAASTSTTEKLKQDEEKEKESAWGEEVIPGIYLRRGPEAAATNAQAEAIIAATQQGASETDLKVIYEKIEEAELLIKNLVDSNEELLRYFTEEETEGEEGEGRKKHSGNQDDEDDEEEEEETMDSITSAFHNNNNNNNNHQAHSDPNNNPNSASAAVGGATGMDALLSMSNDSPPEDDENDENEDNSNNEKNKKKKRKKKYDGENPNPVLMLNLPTDISDSILENLQIIEEKRREIKEFKEFTAVRQHKCGLTKVHGAREEGGGSGESNVTHVTSN